MSERHAVAVVGGAVAGAEIASTLAEAGAFVAVFEQNARPFGKIQDGLPRWHAALRRAEFERIQKKLSHPNVAFVPNTKVGTDVRFDDLIGEHGFSAVILACGAWRDRPLPVEGAEAWLGKGLFYQNPFIIAFNAADAPIEEVRSGALVIGGGLASIDVAKVLQLDGARKRLWARGIEVDLEEMEKAGIPKTLEQHGLDMEAIELAPATLCYRREAEDMPLIEFPPGADEARREKTKRTRLRALEKAMTKYGFAFEPLCRPEAIEGGDWVERVVFRRMAKDGGKLVATDETFSKPASMIVSSIGSIPEPIPGVHMNGELIDFEDGPAPRLRGFDNVFSAGNVVTGKGNIIASRKHAGAVASNLLDTFLGLSGSHADETPLAEQIEATAKAHAQSLSEKVNGLPRATPERLQKLQATVAARQKEVGYDDLASWMAAHAAR